MSSNGAHNTRFSVINCTVEAVELMGGKNILAMKHSGIIFVDLTETEADNLRNSGCIVEPVETVRADVIAPPEPAPVSLQPLITPASVLRLTKFEDLRRLTSPPLYGQGMKVAMIDTGIRETHEQVAGRVIYSKNYTTAPMRDGFSHGTAVSSILAGVAPECGILNLKVMDDKGEGTTEAVVLAIEDCIDLLETRPEIAPSVINLSLGTEDTGDPYDVLRVACRTAIAKGIWLNAAAGNCLTSESLVSTPSGPVPIKDIQPGHEVYSMDTTKVVSRAATAIISSGVRKVYRLKTTHRQIEATDNHPFLAVEWDTNKYNYSNNCIAIKAGDKRLSWTTLSDIKPGYMIVVAERLPEGQLDMDEDLAYLAGVYLGDGNARIRKSTSWKNALKGEVIFSVPEEDKARSKVIGAIRKHFNVEPGGNKNSVWLSTVQAAQEFIDLGFGSGTLNKRVPNWAFCLRDAPKRKFIEGYVDSDGSSAVEKNTLCWNFGTPNKELISRFRLLLISAGIRVTNLSWRNKSIKITNKAGKTYSYPDYGYWLFEAYPSNPRSIHPGPAKLLGIQDGLLLETVKSIEPIGERETYDITVDNAHNFIAEGIVCHNSGPRAGTIMSPACERYVFANGSGRLTQLDSRTSFEVSDFSSRGPTKEGLIKPDAIFFGENIQMASSESDTAVAAKSGTSFATPFTSGLMILYMQVVLVGAHIPKEEYLGLIKELPAAEYTTEFVSATNMLDKYLQYITLKPQGIAKAKDNIYGHGLPFGDLVVQMVGVAPAVNLGALVSGMMIMGMMGMVVKTVTVQKDGKK